MSRKKSISNYQKQQREAEKKRRRKKTWLMIAVVVAALLIVSTVAGVLGYVISRRPVTVIMEIKDYGTVTLELYPDVAPITVRNFKKYVKQGFYDGLTFHRVIENFMIQGGDPTGTGSGDSSLKKIKGEFSMNGFENNLKFERGVIGMARSNDYDSASSQFFICHKTTTSLDGLYASFGKVIDGMDVIDAIATCEKTDTVDSSGNYYVPAETVIIERMYLA